MTAPGAAGNQVETDAASARWLIGVGAGVLILLGSYVLAVLTASGQALENAALRGADQLLDDDITAAGDALGQITVWSLAVAVVAVAAIGLLRRRIDLAIAAVGVIVLGQVITQTLKRFVLPRPPLVEVTGDFMHNSFPSGHTTIAMTVLFAVILVVPYRWRGWALLFVLTWAVFIGAYTVTAKWHRFSDTLGADAVALLCACAASWWLARRGAVRRYDGPPRRGRVVLAVVCAVVTLALLVIGLVLWGVPLVRGTDVAVPDPVQDYTAYLGAHALAAAGSGAAALAFWGLWHRREVAPRAARAAS